MTQQSAEIAAVEREQNVGTGEGCDEDGLVLGHVECERPVEGEFVTFNCDASTERRPGTGGIRWFIYEVIADFTQNPR